MPAIQSNPAFQKGTGMRIQNNNRLWSDIQQELRHAMLSSFQKGRGKNFSEINTFLQNHSLQKKMQ